MFLGMSVFQENHIIISYVSTYNLEPHYTNTVSFKHCEFSSAQGELSYLKVLTAMHEHGSCI